VTAISSLTPASSNTPIQNYGYLVPSPFMHDSIPSSATTTIAPYRGLNRGHVDTDRASLPALQPSVESMMESLRNVKKPPPKPPRKLKHIENPDTELADKISKVELQCDENEEMVAENVHGSVSNKLTSSIRKYNQRKQEKRNVVASDHDVDIKFYGNQRYVERKPDNL